MYYKGRFRYIYYIIACQLICVAVKQPNYFEWAANALLSYLHNASFNAVNRDKEVIHICELPWHVGTLVNLYDTTLQRR